jgi:gamma-glutamyltranspeptidase / glutathione hydrolase
MSGQTMRPSPHGIKSEAFAPSAMGMQGAVVANHPLAAMAGMEVLIDGGNAVDAALAIGFTLGAAEPQGSGIGGDGIVMVHMQKAGTLEVVNGTGAAPLAATPERYQGTIPLTGILSVSVPGVVDALLETHGRYGTLAVARCLEPAIALCEDGVPVSHYQARIAPDYEHLHRFPTSAAIFAPDGRPLRAGEVRRNPDLAGTYRLIAEGGRDAFYEGEIAHRLVRFSEEQGGLLTLEDLRRHRSRWQDPITTTYRGRSVYESPPNTNGHVLLQQLNLIEAFDMAALGHNTADAIHVMVEAKRLAFADREAYLADPEFVDVPVAGLLSKDYAAQRANLIDLGRASANVREGDAWAFQAAPPDGTKRFHRPGGDVDGGSDTTHFCVVDRWGNAVSELQSIQNLFGSQIVADGTGILLNNRMTYWHLDPDHIDRLHGGQRVRHTMNPVMVFEAPAEAGGRLELMCGTPGADTQVQTNMQVVSAIFDHDLTVGEAMAAPRWTHHQERMNSTFPHAERNALEIEDRLGSDVAAELGRLGHTVEVLEAWGATGSAGAIQVNSASGALMAAADPRRDGQALVW